VTSNGAYAGFSTVSTAESWSIDAQGGVRDAFAAGFASSGGARGFKQDTAGTVAVNANNTISFHYPAQNDRQAYDENYITVGWFVGPEVTLLKVQGPFAQPVTAQDLNDATANSYRNHTFVTKRPHP